MIMKKILTLGLVLSLLLSNRLVFAQDSQVIRLGQAMTTAGDMIINNTRAQPARLPIGSTGQILTVDATGIPQWSATLPAASTFTTLTGTASTSLIVTNTADASDNKRLTLAGGGSNSVTRGAFINLNGNEAASTGSISLNAGDVAGGTIDLITRSNAINLYTGNLLRWRIDTSGNLSSDVTNGGNIIFDKAGTGIVNDYAGAVAAGTTIADAVQTAAVLTTVTGSDGVKGAKLIDGLSVGQSQVVNVTGGSGVLKLYPPDGAEQILPAAAGASNDIAVNATATCTRVSATQWFCTESPAA